MYSNDWLESKLKDLKENFEANPIRYYCSSDGTYFVNVYPPITDSEEYLAEQKRLSMEFIAHLSDS